MPHLLTQGLDTDQPKLRLSNGCTYTGIYEQTIGTDLVLSLDQEPSAAQKLSYLCHTESRLKFLRSTRVQQQSVPQLPAPETTVQQEATSQANPAH